MIQPRLPLRTAAPAGGASFERGMVDQPRRQPPRLAASPPVMIVRPSSPPVIVSMRSTPCAGWIFVRAKLWSAVTRLPVRAAGATVG